VLRIAAMAGYKDEQVYKPAAEFFASKASFTRHLVVIDLPAERYFYRKSVAYAVAHPEVHHIVILGVDTAGQQTPA
jgi:hypothetical protein